MYTILAVDDAKDTLMLLEFDLVEEGYNVLTANSGEEALELLIDTHVDLILLDMYMPGLSGLALLEKIKCHEKTADTPVIMLSASDDEDQIVAALELGADDYVTKPYIARVLLARMGTSFRLMEKNQALETLAKTDFLTGVNNRGCFEDEANKLISQAQRSNQELVIVMLDIDLFKQVNDQYGHESGDNVLKHFAKQLTDCFRDYDLIGRIGGEEFAVCMPGTAIEDAVNACERLREVVKSQNYPIPYNEKECFVITVSIGVASGSGAGLNFESLLREADSGLYYAKNNGRDRTINANKLENGILIEHYTSDNTELITDVQVEHMNIEQEVTPSDEHNALEENKLVVQSTEEQIMSSDNEKFPGIDYEIGVGNVLGDGDLFEEILVMFYEDHAHDDEKLNTAITTQDTATSKHVAHTLKGVACSIGAMDLFEVTKALDIAINDQDEEKLPELFPAVKVELKKVVAGLEANLAGKLG